jgi:hypothetical protein
MGSTSMLLFWGGHNVSKKLWWPNQISFFYKRNKTKQKELQVHPQLTNRNGNTYFNNRMQGFGKRCKEVGLWKFQEFDIWYLKDDDLDWSKSAKMRSCVGEMIVMKW